MFCTKSFKGCVSLLGIVVGLQFAASMVYAECLLVVASRLDVEEARIVATTYTNGYASVELLETKNGRFAISLGTLERTAGDDVTDIVREYGLPQDTFCMNPTLAIRTLPLGLAPNPVVDAASDNIPGRGPNAAKLGLYFPSDEGMCRENDYLISGVCVPVTALVLGASTLDIGLAEMTNPELIPIMLSLSAYEVEIEDYSNDLFVLVDGSILENTSSGYVGYVGYHQDAILFNDYTGWNLCVNGSIHSVDVLKNVEYHYSRSALGIARDELQRRVECS